MEAWGDFKMKPQKFKKLQTKHLDLKPLPVTFKLASEIFDIISNNRDYYKFLPWSNVKQPEQEFAFLSDADKNWKNQSEATYGMYLCKDGSFAGVCTMFDIDWDKESSEFGYWLNIKYAGHGLMSEAVKAISNEFFNMGFKRIVIKANPENFASCKVAEKCGFEREGVLRSYDFLPALNKREDIALYAKIKEK